MRSAAAKGKAVDGRVRLPADRLVATTIAPGRGTPSSSRPAASLAPRAPTRPCKQEKSIQSLNPGPCIDTKNEVVAFLKDCGLQMYVVQLLQNGFDEMETLHAIDDVDMRQLGIPPYHAERLRKSLEEAQQKEHVDAEGTQVAVVAFLEEHGLGQYTELLLRSGFDDMETLSEVDDADLKDLGLPRGHALKLKRHLRNYMVDPYTEEKAVVAQPVALSSTVRQPRVVAPPRPAPHLSATSKMKGDVVQSWETIQKLGTSFVCERIYRAFFEEVPEAMDCFPIHVRLKYRDWMAEEEDDLLNSAALKQLFAKVINAIGCTVAGLNDSHKLVPRLSILGARHISYGVSEAFWPALGKALNNTLQDLLGDGFTPEVANAWNVVYGFMSSIMIEGLRKAKEAAQGAQEAAQEARAFDGECALSQSSRATGRSRASED